MVNRLWPNMCQKTPKMAHYRNLGHFIEGQSPSFIYHWTCFIERNNLKKKFVPKIQLEFLTPYWGDPTTPLIQCKGAGIWVLLLGRPTLSYDTPNTPTPLPTAEIINWLQGQNRSYPLLPPSPGPDEPLVRKNYIDAKKLDKIVEVKPSYCHFLEKCGKSNTPQTYVRTWFPPCKFLAKHITMYE